MLHSFSRPTFWLEFRLLSDGLETAAVQSLPLTEWHNTHNPVFLRFPALPAELRLKIWEYLIAPRIVGIACLCQEDGAPSVEVQRNQLWGPHSIVKSPIPVLLHVNRETRALALKHYELSFEWKVPRELAGTDLHPPVPVRSPILAGLVLPPAGPESAHTPAQNPLLATDSVGASISHMSSYHDLLDRSPVASTATQASTSTTLETAGPSRPAMNSLPLPDPAPRRTSSPPRTWFNFGLDAVYLLGELEPCDSFGFNNPMTYFIPSRTARRVRKTAVSFGALRYGETGGQQIFGALFHVVDRFVSAPAGSGDRGGELLVCVTERDEWTHAMMGNETGLVNERYRHIHNDVAGHVLVDNAAAATTTTTATATAADPDDEGNVVQQIWRDWYRGAIVTSPLANLRFSLIPEKDLEHHVYDFMVRVPAKQRRKKLDGYGGNRESDGGSRNCV
ncbi:hypothetical protein SAMD00023353_0502780 [Rosellinia necatrix]|uniref:2EXR domain-containing protein n=1 Tax=Rosellinia necatrix TaxID=77044 RepID=A0A1S7UKN8_ROSNE|nr:hypothetical protein SAMD00023353_0502780 [Rosellinia necatrix]